MALSITVFFVIKLMIKSWMIQLDIPELKFDKKMDKVEDLTKQIHKCYLHMFYYVLSFVIFVLTISALVRVCK